VAGSEYTPDAARIPHPAIVAAKQARRQARRIHRHLPQTLQGHANRRHGRAAERLFAHRLHGHVNPGSGQWDARPNDVYIPGWQCEIRERRRQFGRVWHALAQADGLQLPQGEVILPYPVFATFHPATPTDPWALPAWWRWQAIPQTTGWTTLLRWVHDPREHPDVVIVRTGPHGDGPDAFVILPQGPSGLA
jgi:hypothetical protein